MQIFLVTCLKSRAWGMALREHGAHRDSGQAGFLLPNFELAGPLRYVYPSPYECLEDESTPV